ncbi:MAG: aldehyde dehydrogenase family protein, partial [Nitrososphaeraceae archaeon]|nr:aldehyde dehydrogenase family protein [Nitrososphaeraceae archaeon]
MEQFDIINPADETVIERYTPLGKVDVNSKIRRLYRANKYWRELKPHSRIKLFEAFKENIKNDRESLAKSSTMEVGKPLKESLSEVDKCINIIDFYIKNGEEMLHSLVTTSDAEHTEILHDPLG